MSSDTGDHVIISGMLLAGAILKQKQKRMIILPQFPSHRRDSVSWRLTFFSRETNQLSLELSTANTLPSAVYQLPLTHARRVQTYATRFFSKCSFLLFYVTLDYSKSKIERHKTRIKTKNNTHNHLQAIFKHVFTTLLLPVCSDVSISINLKSYIVSDRPHQSTFSIYCHAKFRPLKVDFIFLAIYSGKKKFK